MAVIAYTAFGLWMGLWLGGVNLAIHFLAGGIPSADGTVMPPFMTFSVFVFYCGVGGLIVGIGRRLLVTRTGAAFLLSFGSLPLFIGIGVLYYGTASIDWFPVLFGAVVVGAPLGVLFRTELKQSTWSPFGGNASSEPE